MSPLQRIRAICLALPEVTERVSHGAPSWFVRDKTNFANFWEHGHHQDEFPHLTLAAPDGAQGELIATDPDRFFRPPDVGHRGWIGVRVDADSAEASGPRGTSGEGRIGSRNTDWTEVAELCEDAYRVVAPKRLIRMLDRGPA